MLDGVIGRNLKSKVQGGGAQVRGGGVLQNDSNITVFHMTFQSDKCSNDICRTIKMGVMHAASGNLATLSTMLFSLLAGGAVSAGIVRADDTVRSPRFSLNNVHFPLQEDFIQPSFMVHS